MAVVVVVAVAAAAVTVVRMRRVCARLGVCDRRLGEWESTRMERAYVPNVVSWGNAIGVRCAKLLMA